MFRNPSNEEIRALLKAVKTIAVVGLSDNPARPSYRVARAMQGFGYTIIPVRPAQAEVLGAKAYAQLTDLPGIPDLVDVFRNPEAVPEIVDQCIAIGVKRLWLQEGVIHEAAAERARAAGIAVVMDRCVWKDAVSLLPSPLPGEGGDGGSPQGGSGSLTGPALGRPGGGTRP